MKEEETNQIAKSERKNNKKKSEKTFIGAMLWIIIIYKSFKEDGDAEIVLETPNMNVFGGGKGLHAPHKMILHADSYKKLWSL